MQLAITTILLLFSSVCLRPAAACPTMPECQHVVCLDIHDPVCGSDGHLYHNRCYLKKANCRLCGNGTIHLANDEMCGANLSTTPAYTPTVPCPTPGCQDLECPDDCDPVCGSDGRLYHNQCYLEQANCHLCGTGTINRVKDEMCQANLSTTTVEPETTTPLNCENIKCPIIFKPVCGSDGKTYSNACVLGAENCKRGPDDEICIEHEGFCSQSQPETTTMAQPETTTLLDCDNIPCALIFEPVCGSDGETYSNACVLRAENCKRGPDDEIIIEHEGFCSSCSSKATSTVEPETTTPLNCENIPCPLIFMPVCGSDGQTYSNACVLGAENCKRGPDDEICIEHEGFCSPSQPETTTVEPETTTPLNCENIPCPLIFKPVCGSDGKTYSNACVLGAENCKRGPDDEIFIEHAGFCSPSQPETTTVDPETTTPLNCENIPCPLIFKPVCGSDGKTYSNACVLGAENCKRGPDDEIFIEHAGFCSPSQPETTTVDPKTTTPLNCENIPCPLIFKPVCGSDGKTYSNACVLGAENCERGPDDEIFIENEGFCSPSQPETTTVEPETTTPLNCENIPCPLIFKPVCGSDGKTYSNACVLGAENCERGPDDKIFIEHEGFCSPSQPETTTVQPETTMPYNCDYIPCPLLFNPVCGSDGVIYSNACVLGVENCNRGPDDKITIDGWRSCGFFK